MDCCNNLWILLPRCMEREARGRLGPLICLGVALFLAVVAFATVLLVSRPP